MNEFIYGCCGGLLGTVVSHPIDTIRINLQSGVKPNYSFLSLYKGLLSPLIGIGIEKAVVFGSYNYLDKELSKYSQFSGNSAMIKFFAGVGSGLASTAVVTPVEYFKIQRQNGNKINFKNLSLKGLYRGWTATLFREVPGYGIYFTTYNTVIDKFGKNPLSIFLGGGLSGLTAWICIYPADYIKTRMQYHQTAFFKTTKAIIAKEGLLGMYRGCTLALVRAFVLHCTVFVGYEYSKKLWT